MRQDMRKAMAQKLMLLFVKRINGAAKRKRER